MSQLSAPHAEDEAPNFRVASIGTQAVFRTGVGALFAFASRRRSTV